MRSFVIGSRGSRLALWQAEWLRARIAEAGRDASIRIIHTEGDLLRDQPLPAVGGKGLFVKEIEEAILAGAVDLAAHSLKDLPTSQPGGLRIVCVPAREDPRDVLLAPGGPGVAGLRRGAVVGTGSPRRACQIRALRSDLETRNLRGNVDTRLAKLKRGDCDAILLARAGLSRLGIEAECSVLSLEEMLPAPGQGAMAIETRDGDPEIEDLLRPHHHEPTAAAVTAERAFLRGLGGGCQAPIAAIGEVVGSRLILRGLVAGPDGHPLLRDRREGRIDEADPLGLALAGALLSRGAAACLAGSPEPPPEAP